MSTSASSHIPVLSIPKFKSLTSFDPALVDVLEPDEDQVPTPSEEDRLQAEFERGIAEGDARTRAHYEALLERERETHLKLLEEERLRFEMREAANVSASIERFLDVVEQRISYSLTKLLHPFLEQQITEKLVSAFAGNLRQLTQEKDEVLIRLRGPENLIEQVLEHLPALRDRIDTEITEQLELVALLDETTIETRLSQWLAQLEDLHREAD
ncbi:MAG: hypothetical protein K5905_22960 [Roseibium sp.]|uniref:hypothetical protein n=1 Tax=Roseibium sp. TaxID=1936156 RepID=UPI002621FF99|nr:hypothetical protein [Roseibium sp.]MCV0428327.1 hypothetical protein [Roseibium sp.]